MYGDFGHNMVAWRATRHGLGDVVISQDQAILLGLGFNSAQIQQIQSAYASGALSDAGYNQIVSGNVDPGKLADFIDADPGAPTMSNSIPSSPIPAPPMSNSIRSSPIPAPPMSNSIGSFFTGSTLISGIPNWLVLAVGLMLPVLLMGADSSGRRR